MTQRTILTAMTLILFAVNVAQAQNMQREVIGTGSVSAWDREFSEHYIENAQEKAIADAQEQCEGEVSRKSQWSGRHFKNGGSDGEATSWTYMAVASFNCL